MENKYYIPSLEEFCINFEYEILKTKSVYDDHWKFEVKKLIFNKEAIKSNFDLFDILHYYDKKQLRVKYLDKEDIESLGFILDEARASGFHFYLNNYELAQPYLDSRCYLKQINNKEILFNGIIKNKSELKRLLKQLGINE